MTPISSLSDTLDELVFVGLLRISDPLGLHLRSLVAFAQMARQYQATVTVSCGRSRGDGKSPADLLLLGAARGVELRVEAYGQDARPALEALLDLPFVSGEKEPDPVHCRATRAGGPLLKEPRKS